MFLHDYIENIPLVTWQCLGIIDRDKIFLKPAGDNPDNVDRIIDASAEYTEIFIHDLVSQERLYCGLHLVVQSVLR
jgi:hypothetical protein